MKFPALQSLRLWLSATEHNADSPPASVKFFPREFRQAGEWIANNYMRFCDFKHGHIVVNQETKLYHHQCLSGVTEFLDVPERPERQN